MIRLVVLAALVGCAWCELPDAPAHEPDEPRDLRDLRLSDRPANHGASQRSLAPNETAQIKVRGGKVEPLAVSTKVEIDEHTRDQPSVTQDLELIGRSRSCSSMLPATSLPGSIVPT